MSAFGVKKDWIEIMNYYGEEDKESFSLEDFQAIMNDNMADRYSKQEIDKIYDVFDMDGHGITVENIKNIAKEIDEYITVDEIQEIIQEADRDGDGKLDRNEFYQ
jgi:Ca2+-binding EF-hand superfamily protein